MEIRGEDFIKKVQLKQEKSEIEQRLKELQDAESVYEEQEEPQAPIPPRLDKEIEIQEEQEYSDIMLGKEPSSNEQNKKKYLVLGLVLVILFLLTIIVIRLLTNDSPTDDSFSKSKDSNSEKVLENENIEEQYQKIINEKLKTIKEEQIQKNSQDEEVDEKLNLEKIEEKEKVVNNNTETKPDPFEIKKEEKIYKPTKKVAVEEPKPKPVVKKVVEKKVEKPVVKKVVTKTTNAITTKPKGTFVQIGAFSKMPSDKYLRGISSKGFSYKIYKVSINNKLFHKVLIGPYNSRGQAKLAIGDIKKKLNITGAFILKF